VQNTRNGSETMTTKVANATTSKGATWLPFCFGGVTELYYAVHSARKGRNAFNPIFPGTRTPSPSPRKSNTHLDTPQLPSSPWCHRSAVVRTCDLLSAVIDMCLHLVTSQNISEFEILSRMFLILGVLSPYLNRSEMRTVAISTGLRVNEDWGSPDHATTESHKHTVKENSNRSDQCSN